MNRRQFCELAILGTFSLAVAGSIYHKSKLLNNNETNLELGHIEVSLVDYCNLNCKYCCHFAPLADKKIYEYKQYKKDLERIAKLTNSKLSSIALLGGEPLLHPDIEKVIKITRKIFPDTEMRIVTNALLLNSMPESFWKALAETGTVLGISIYNVEINWHGILEKIKKYNISNIMNSTFPFEKEEDIKKIKENIMKDFANINLDINGKQKKHITCKQCFTSCFILQDSKIYRCPVISNLKYFNKYFNQNVQFSENDYFDIYKSTDIKESLNKLSQPTGFCARYCGQQNRFKWENTAHHTIDEWAQV